MKLITLFLSILFATLFAWAGVDLNTASPQELESLPGIGKKGAQDILAARPFQSVDDLRKVKGIGDVKFQKLQPLVQVGSPAAAPTPTGTTAKMSDSPGAPTAAPARSGNSPRVAPGTVVNINTATREQLESLPGIGPLKAQAIIQGRPFATVDDLKKVKGIKDGIIAKIRPFVSFQ